MKDFESNQTLCEGIELFSGLVPRYALFERLYLRPTFPLQDVLEQALVKLYATALKYLLKAQEYYTTKTISMCFPSPRTNFSRLNPRITHLPGNK